jgi:DNA polymerase V
MKVNEIIVIDKKESRHKYLPIFTALAQAGAPVAVKNSIDDLVDINDFLVSNPSETFFARVHSENNFYGIKDNDIVIVDSSIEIYNGCFVCSVREDKLFVNKYHKTGNGEYLETYSDEILEIGDSIEKNQIIGVITKVIHSI